MLFAWKSRLLQKSVPQTAETSNYLLNDANFEILSPKNVDCWSRLVKRVGVSLHWCFLREIDVCCKKASRKLPRPRIFSLMILILKFYRPKLLIVGVCYPSVQWPALNTSSEKRPSAKKCPERWCAARPKYDVAVDIDLLAWLAGSLSLRLPSSYKNTLVLSFFPSNEKKTSTTN